MRIFSYRNKRNLKRALWIALAVVLAAITLFICRVVYLERFVTYTSEGAKLDYDQKIDRSEDLAEPLNPEDYPFQTLLDNSAEEEAAQGPQQMRGYYVTSTMLNRHFDQVTAAIDELEEEADAIMLDAKSIFGFYYYSTGITGAETADTDIDAIDGLIRELAARDDLTLIARVPAFCDPEYALRNQEDALPLYSGALWTDENRCYWLNPYKNDVQGYLASIAIELSKLGFDEVLFDGFYVPTDDAIKWSTEITREEAAIDAAMNISDSLYGYGIQVSFGTRDPAIAKYASRIYITSNDAGDVAKVSEAMEGTLSNPAAQIVFLTHSRDTRFEACSVLAPLLDVE